MAFLGEEFSTEDLPQGGGTYEVLPPGWYNVSINSADLMQTKSGTGQYIKLRLDVTGPTHQGRVVFANINVKNDSQKAEEIGRQQLGELMRAIGLPRVRDTDQLIGGNLQVKLTVKHYATYGESNEVKGYKAIGGGSPMTAPAASKPASAPPASSKTAPPWAKK